MIGLFDSGIGGLTVAKAIMDMMPDYDLIYFGDTARTPYGNKSPETVVKYALQNTRFLLDKGATIIVIACNTASSTAIDAITAKFKGLPVFEVITPAVEDAIAATRNNRIGVIGTRATIASGIYEKKIKEQAPDAKVFSAACPLLVPLVEEDWIRKPETRMIVKKYLLPLKTRQVDTLILGCTHYPVLSDIIQAKIGKRVAVIDSSKSTAARLKKAIEEDPDLTARLTKNKSARFYVSDITPQFEKTAQKIIKKRLKLSEARI